LFRYCVTVTYLTNFADTAGRNNDSISKNAVHNVYDESEWPAGVGTSSAGTARGRTFQSNWMSKYPWITYSDSKVFCQVCQKCDQLGLFTFTHQRDEAFTGICPATCALLRKIYFAHYFAIIIDETTDASCTEQVRICIRYVTQNLKVQETFKGFYETTATDASTIIEIAQDVVTRLELKLLICRGQCYDGAATMSGKLTGLQKIICDIQPKALFVHCMNHSLNLAIQDSVSGVQQCRDAINQIRELINFCLYPSSSRKSQTALSY